MPVECNVQGEKSIELGYCSPPILDCAEDRLWEAMTAEIKSAVGHYDKFVAEVVVLDGEPGSASQRTMFFKAPGPLQGTTITENIYQDFESGEIRLRKVREDGHEEKGTEVVHKLLRNPLRIEYFQRNVKTAERIPICMSPAAANDAFSSTIRQAHMFMC